MVKTEYPNKKAVKASLSKELLKFLSKKSKSVKRDFDVNFYFENCDNSFKQLVTNAHYYFKRNRKGARYPGFAATTAAFAIPPRRGISYIDDGSPLNYYKEVYKAANQISHFCTYLGQNRAAGNHPNCHLFIAIDDEVFFQVV